MLPNVHHLHMYRYYFFLHYEILMEEDVGIFLYFSSHIQCVILTKQDGFSSISDLIISCIQQVANRMAQYN